MSSLKTIYDSKCCTHCCVIDGGLNYKTFLFSFIIGYFEEKLINFRKIVYEYSLEFLLYFIIYLLFLFIYLFTIFLEEEVCHLVRS